MYLVPKKAVTNKSASNLEIRWIQLKLGVTVDGKWGSKTAAAMMNHRKKLNWKPGTGYSCTAKMIEKLKLVTDK